MALARRVGRRRIGVPYSTDEDAGLPNYTIARGGDRSGWPRVVEQPPQSFNIGFACAGRGTATQPGPAVEAPVTHAGSHDFKGNPALRYAA